MTTAIAAPRRPSKLSGVELEGWDVVCFSNDWRGDPLSKTHLMRLLARHNRVPWVNSIGYRTPSVTSRRDLSRGWQKMTEALRPVEEVEPNLFVLCPLAVPSGRVVPGGSTSAPRGPPNGSPVGTTWSTPATPWNTSCVRGRSSRTSTGS